MALSPVFSLSNSLSFCSSFLPLTSPKDSPKISSNFLHHSSISDIIQSKISVNHANHSSTAISSNLQLTKIPKSAPNHFSSQKLILLNTPNRSNLPHNLGKASLASRPEHPLNHLNLIKPTQSSSSPSKSPIRFTHQNFHDDEKPTRIQNLLASSLESAYIFIPHQKLKLSPSHHNSRKRNPKISKQPYQMEDQLSRAISQMTLGAYDPPTPISAEAQAQAQVQGLHSIVVRRLHHTQNAQRLRDLLVDLWKLDDRRDAIIQENGTLVVTFSNEIRMMNILNEEPWHFKGWFLAIDLWTNRFTENFLENVMLWVKLLNVPGDYKHEAALMDLGKRIGIPVRSMIRQSNRGLGSDCLVLVKFNIHSKLKFVQHIEFPPNPEPVRVQFVYEKLRYYCTICGAILHSADECLQNNHPGQGQQALRPPRDPEVDQPPQQLNQNQPRARELHPHRNNLPALLPTPSSSSIAGLLRTPQRSEQGSPTQEEQGGSNPRSSTVRPTVGVLRLREPQNPQPVQEEPLEQDQETLEPLTMADFPNSVLPPISDEGLQAITEAWPLALVPFIDPIGPNDLPPSKNKGKEKVTKGSESTESVDEELEVESPQLAKKMGKRPEVNLSASTPKKTRARARVIRKPATASTQNVAGQEKVSRKRKIQDAQASQSARLLKARTIPTPPAAEITGLVAPEKPPVQE